jgi:Circularly permutated YpsA SLOG family
MPPLLAASWRDERACGKGQQQSVEAMLKIVSGGQTGIDRAALDVALELGLFYGGWCPRGGWAEDLPNPPGLVAIYPGLQETPETSPLQRTRWNVRDSDRLMVLVDSAGLSVSKGAESTLAFAERLDKPHTVIDLNASGAADQAVVFLSGARARLALCIAGPRESEAPGIYAKAVPFLRVLLGRITR